MKKITINHNKLKNLSPTYIRLMSYFLLSVTIPVSILAILLYNSFNKSTINELDKSIKKNLLQTSYCVESMLYSCKYAVSPILNDQYIQFYTSTRNFSDSQIGKKITDEITSYSDSNILIHSMYVYSAVNHSYITSLGYYTQQDFFDDFFINYCNKPQTKPYDIITTRPLSYPKGSLPINIISMVFNQSNNNNELNSVIVVNIDESNLYNIIKDINKNDFNSIFIIDPNGRIISHSNKALLLSNVSNKSYYKKIVSSNSTVGTLYDKIDDKTCLISYITGENGWKYIYTSDYLNITKSSRDIRNTVIFICLILIIIGIILSYLATNSIYNPIKKLVSTASNLLTSTSNSGTGESRKNSRNNEFNYIQSTLINFHTQANQLKSTLDSSIPLLRERFILNLLNGKVTDDMVNKQSEDFLKVKLFTDSFVVITLKVDDFEDYSRKFDIETNNLFNFAINNIFEELLPNSCSGYTVEYEPNCLVFLLNFYKSVEQDSIKDLIAPFTYRLQIEVSKFLGYSVSIGIGRPAVSYREIPQSFNQSLDATKYTVIKGTSSVIFWQDVLREVVNDKNYSIDKEKQIISSLKSGNLKNVSLILDSLVIELRLAHYDKAERILTLILMSIIKSCYEMGVPISNENFYDSDIFNQFYSLKTIDIRKDFIVDLCERAILAVSERGKNKNQELICKALEYIRINLSKDISLEEMAELLDITPNYFSKLFKEGTGQNFIDFLTEVRMKKAAELLTASSLKIRDIYQQIGFTSQQYFAGVFKKYYGITPSQYQDLHK